MKFSSRISLCLLLTAFVIGSCSKQNLYIAQDYQKDYKYADAITFYKKAVENNPSKEAVKGLAECYRILRDYPLAEVWYGKAYSMDNRNPEVVYQYAMMLKANGKYDEAISFFNAYKKVQPTDSLYANLQIKGCNMAAKWMEEPLDYELANRDDINSPYSEFGMQQAKENGETIYLLSTNRPGRVTEDFLLANENKDPYFEMLAVRLNDINKADQMYQYRVGENFPYHVATPSFSANYDTVFYTRTPISKERLSKEKLNQLEIYYSVKVDNQWSNPIPFPFNNEAFSTGHPFLTKDGKSLYFISDIPGGMGGFDIYVSQKKDGLWQRPENLGMKINTREDEFYPVFSNGYLYFSSAGLMGMGGLDIYKSLKIAGEWSAPENLQVPFNSPQDDFAFFQTPGSEGKKGFISSNRIEGRGKDDIYSFNYIDPLPPVFLVNVKGYNNGEPITGTTNAQFTIFKKGNPADIAQQYVDVYGNSYYIVEQGENYEVKANVPGYFQEAQDLSYDHLQVSDTMLIKKDLPKQYGYEATLPFNLRKIAVGTEYTINNIYFDFNSAKIRKSAEVELIQLANLLLANKGFKVEIGSHCDARGSDEYNMILSQRRAKSVMNFLILKGVNKNRLSYQGYGETQILNECVNGVDCTDEQHEENRRTTFKIVE
ncbi:OmpA family protein [Luteibaculum oceani]|uniref:OmpA family protein n=1 Tax=Luteibaculum oceani TaxID=1294296 RepID=A0A5C6VBZ1_9FLAO|nr:OmpA family protein [Luteibaculum oceani]TXC82026.1 OmpA family protein [Luteibaculum oceani]